MRTKRFVGVAIFIAALCSAAVVCAQSVPKASPESVGMSAQRLERISDVFKQHVEKGNLPGVVAMVARKGKLVYFNAIGFQDKSANVPMSKDSIFRIYSMTKPLVAVGAMMLVEDGVIELDDPVSKFLPALDKLKVSVPAADGSSYTMVPQAKPITVQDLLRHTAGLSYGELTKNQPVKEAYVKAGLFLTGVGDQDSRVLTPAEQVARIAEVPLSSQPGTVFEYGWSADILGRVIEAASGKRLDDFLRERLFKPLKMDDTAFWVSPPNVKRIAQPLTNEPITGKANNVYDVTKQPNNDSAGVGGVSTASDFLRFSQMLLNGGTIDGVRIMSRPTVAFMTSDHLGLANQTPGPGEVLLRTSGYTFGLGFMVRPAQGMAGIPGSTGEFMWGGWAGTFFWVDPQEKLVGIYMVQAPSPIRAFYQKLFKQMVYQAIAD